MKQILGSLFLLSLLTAASCKKHDHNHAHPADVNTTISSPAAGQSFRVGDTVRIQATVQYSGEMHGWKAIITDSASGTEHWSMGEDHVHGDNFNVTGQWVPASNQTGTAKLQIRTAIDHEGTEAAKEIFFHVLP